MLNRFLCKWIGHKYILVNAAMYRFACVRCLHSEKADTSEPTAENTARFNYTGVDYGTKPDKTVYRFPYK